MSCSINLFAVPEIEAEFPDNNYSITLKEQDTKTTITMYLDLFQWWQIRTIFPRSKTYTFHTISGADALRGEAADDWALQFYDEQKAKFIQKPLPEETSVSVEPELEEMPF